MDVKIKRILLISIILVLMIQVVLPIVSKASENDVNSKESDVTMNIELKRDETNSNIINITATDSKYKITDLKYVHKYIETSNVDYFEQNNSDVYTFDITPAQTIKESFELDGYGSYTVYGKNERGDRFLSRLTVNDPNDMPQITITKDEENPLNITIQVTSTNNNITKLKIAKKQNINDTIDFSIQGTDIEFIESNDVTVKYSGITEDGLYVIYAEDSKGNKTTRQLYIGKENTPIQVTITNGSNTREVNLQIKDTICNIVKVKVAKKSENLSFDDFKTKGEELEFSPNQEVNISYTAPEDDTYVFYIEDEAGYKKMTEKRITQNDKNMNIEITQDDNSPTELTIKATNKICNIVKMKVAIGNDVDIEYFKNNGEEIPITAGREVTANYSVSKNCTINIYIEDEQGYSYMLTKTITGIDEPEPNQPPEITLSQNEENPKQIDVSVRDKDSYIDEIKWAKGSQQIEYFKTNGTRIGQGSVGKSINTQFLINEIGVYTVYAKDEEGSEVVKEINITNIDEKPVEDPDTTSPKIDGVENNKIYNQSITPNITDENLSEIYLTRNGNTVERYNNGDTIDEEGKYVLRAVDEAGNETIVNFIIDRTAPEITIKQENTDNENVVASFIFSDALTDVDIVKVAKGEQNINYFQDNGQELNVIKDGNNVKAAINIKQNGKYTIYVRDLAGNAKVEIFEVTTIVEEPEIDDTIKSSKYEVNTSSNMISKITPNTDVSAFKSNISTEVGYKVVDKSGNEIQNSDLVVTGDKLITDTGKEYALIVTGDLNSDGDITISDLSKLRKHILKAEILGDEYQKAADINNDGDVTLNDVSMMRKVILNIEKID